MRPAATLFASLALILGTQAQTATPPIATPAPPAATAPPVMTPPIASPGPRGSGIPRRRGQSTWHAPDIYINPKDWLPSPSPSPRRHAVRPTPRPTYDPDAVPSPEVFHHYETHTPAPH